MTGLPGSLKGYELYSWSKNRQWHFKLMTGTNRSKTQEEIISPENSISETGFFKISVAGIESIKNLLDKTPSDMPITWIGQIQKPSDPTDIVIQLPPKHIIDAVRDHALARKLDFRITAP